MTKKLEITPELKNLIQVNFPDGTKAVANNPIVAILTDIVDAINSTTTTTTAPTVTNTTK